MSGWGWFILVLILLIPICAAGYIFYSRYRAKQNGLPPPSLSSYNPFAHKDRHTDNYPAPSGIVGWTKRKFQSLKPAGSGSGAYEQPLGPGARRGLDPDEAWDARVGAEADGYGAGGGYYEEQELGLRPPGNGPYGGSGYGGQAQALPDYGEERGRSLSRNQSPYIGGGQKGLDERYDQEMGDDPFGDEAERSELRGVSPRPHQEGAGKEHAKQGSGGTQDDSPTERRSMFHENV